MKIGIIVYSQTGNTLSVAEKLKEKLAARPGNRAVPQTCAGQHSPGCEDRSNPDVAIAYASAAIWYVGLSKNPSAFRLVYYADTTTPAPYKSSIATSARIVPTTMNTLPSRILLPPDG